MTLLLSALLTLFHALHLGLDTGISAYVKGDFTEARTVLEPLANAGDGQAQYYIGLMFKRGVAYPRNYVQAYVWFSLSAAQNTKNAATARDELESLMTPQQRAEAQQLAIDWRPTKQGASEAPPIAVPPSPPPVDRPPSRGPASESSESARDSIASYLTAHVRSDDRDHTTPTIDVANCVLTMQWEHLLRHSSVVIRETVRIARIERSRRYDNSTDGLDVTLFTLGSSDVETTRSTGVSRRSRVFSIPVTNDFDFEHFASILKQAIADCRR